MKKMLLLLPLLLSSAAFAGNHQIGFGIGGGSTDGPNDWSDSGFAGKIDYAYQFHPNFAAEIGYAAVDGMTSNIVTSVFGTTKQEVTYSTGFAGLKAAYLLFLSSTYMLSVVRIIRMLRKLIRLRGTERTDTHTGLHPYYGAGTELIFFSTLGLNLEYRKFLLADDFESDVIFAGMNIKF